MRKDETGTFWPQLLIGAAVGLIGSVIDCIVNEEELSWNTVAKVAVATIAGAVGAVVGPVAAAAVSATASAISSAIEGNNLGQIALDATVAAGISFIGAGTQLAVGRMYAGDFVKNASKTGLKQYANAMGYVGRNFKSASSWSGKIMLDASVSFMDKPLAQFAGQGISFSAERALNKPWEMS